MTDVLETKLVNMLDSLQQGAVKVGDTIVQYSPDVIDAGLWVVRIDGIQTLLFSLIFIVLCLASLSFIKRLWVASRLPENEYKGQDIAAAVLSGAWGVFFIPASLSFINIWNWVAVFEPKLWLAKQLVEKTLGN